MAKFCTNCGSELNPGAKFCVNCGQKVEQEQNQQAGAAAVAGVAAGASSSADISYKKSINDSPKQEGFVADDAQANVHTDMLMAILRLILSLMNLSIPILPVQLTPMRIALRQHPKQARSF